MLVSGGRALVAESQVGVHEFDLQDPSRIQWTGLLPISKPIADIEVSDERLLVLTLGSGLLIYDDLESTPRQVDPFGSAVGLAANATHAFVSAREIGLLIVDLDKGEYVGAWHLQNNAHRAGPIFLEADDAYLACSCGFHVIDVQDPTSPFLQLTVEYPGGASDVLVTGEHVMLARPVDIVVWDREGDFSSPCRVLPHIYPWRLNGESDGGVLVSAGWTGVYWLTTGQDCHIDWRIYETVVHARAAASIEAGVLVAGQEGVQTVAASTMPISVTTHHYFDEAVDIRAFGENLLVLGKTGVLSVVDAQTGDVLESLEGLGDVRHLEVSSRLAFVSAGLDGVHIVELDDTHLSHRQTLQTETTCYAAKLRNDVLYVAAGGEGLVRARFDTEVGWATVGSISTAGQARAIEVEDRFAYVGTSLGVDIVDLDSRPPVTVNEILAGKAVSRLLLVGDHLYEFTLAGLWIMDVSDPHTTVFPTEPALPYVLSDLALDQAREVVYAAGGRDGMWILDAIDAPNPRPIARVLSGTAVTQVAMGLESYVIGGAAVLGTGLRHCRN